MSIEKDQILSFKNIFTLIQQSAYNKSNKFVHFYILQCGKIKEINNKIQNSLNYRSNEIYTLENIKT